MKTLMGKQLFTRGFTILELMTVVTVIGILVVIGTVAYNGVTNRAVDNTVISDAEAVATLQTSYSLDNETGGKDWYSPNGSDPDLQFSPSGEDSVIDVVTSDTDYCVRVYSPRSSQYTNIYNAFERGSSESACYFLDPSTQAVSNSQGTPPQFFYNSGFESSLDGWTSGHVNNVVTRSSEMSRTGTFSLKSVQNTFWNGSAGMNGDGARRVINGATIGEEYTITAWVFTDDTNLPRESYWRYIGGSSPQGEPVTLNPGSWTKIELTITAASTDPYIYLYIRTPTQPPTDLITAYVDDIVVKAHSAAP